jgi:CRISPR-associated protein Cmr2
MAGTSADVRDREISESSTYYGAMNIWQRKLLAFLHDPPTKPFNIGEHRAIAQDLITAAELDPVEAALFFAKVCDHTAAAADRVVCPKASVMNADWSLLRAFKHPLGGGNLSFAGEMTAELAEAKVAEAQSRLGAWRNMRPEQKDWARFFLHWRLWSQYCAESHPSLIHLPADTRIPDHSVWTHCSLVSALTSCVEVSGQGEGMTIKEFKPAFLLVQIGPVQEFIAQARTTRDLWSGSYLLSWLLAHGIKAVTDEIGPDCVLFPALRGQPLFDFLHKTDLYEKLGLWNDLRHSEESILTPSLPNRFLAVVPEWQAKELAGKAERATRNELCGNISDACLTWFRDQGHEVNADAIRRWHQQLRQFLTVHWQVWPWAGDVPTAIENFKQLPSGNTPADGQQVAPTESLKRAFIAASNGIPFNDLDPRNYKHRSRKEGDLWKSEVISDSAGQPQVENPGFAWAAHYASAEFWLAARRNTRDFERWGLITGATNEEQRKADESREGSTKDVLSGKEETIGSPEWQKGLSEIEGHFFRDGERIGAVNLIKRVWHAAYLQAKGLNRTPRFDSVPAIAGASWRRRLVDQSAKAGKLRDLLAEQDGFGPLASSASKYFPADIKEWDKHSDREWLDRSDASMFHLSEWDRAIRDEQKRDGGPRVEAMDKLRTARAALAKLQTNREDGGLGKPITYVAVLAMDGDSMGQWVSGAKSPSFEEQLADEARAYFNQEHSEAREPLALQRLLRAPRHVSPSYHLQFSEALASFSLHLARSIVEFFDGQLIYSGGDDILAMLPAERALDCARALRMAFKGDPELCTVFPGVLDTRLRDSQGNPLPPDRQLGWGFVAINGEWPGYSPRERKLFPRGYQLLVPGKNADISAGIAIGHMHTPLQNLVEAARQAEKIAKREAPAGYCKAAFAVHLYKRSGEIVHWGAKWEDHAIKLADRFGELTEAGKLTAKFVYALAAALRPYIGQFTAHLPADRDDFRLRPVNGFDPFKVFSAEFVYALRQHSDEKWRKTEASDSFATLANTFLRQCAGRRLDDFLGPFLTATFIRKRAD